MAGTFIGTKELKTIFYHTSSNWNKPTKERYEKLDAKLKKRYGDDVTEFNKADRSRVILYAELSGLTTTKRRLKRGKDHFAKAGPIVI